MTKIYSFVLLAFMWSAPIALAEEAAPPTQTDTVLQISHILAPTQSRPGSFTTKLRPMTPVLVVPEYYNVALVCQRAPRVIESLLAYFLKNPAPVNRKLRLDSSALEQQKTAMAVYVNHAVGIDAVSEVYIFGGGKSITSGVAARLPGAKASTACGPVLEEYEKQMKAIIQGVE